MSDTLEYDEHALLVGLREGDETAFGRLYDHYKARLASNLFRLLKSWDQVEEILQELFVRIWEGRERIDPEQSFQAYLYRIASNLVNDYFRSVTRDQVLVERLWEQISLAYEPDELRNQLLADEELMRTIGLLPQKRQLVFRMCKLEGKSYAEVAHALGISEAAVNDHITKANRFILQHYNKSISLLAMLFIRILMDGFLY